MNLARVIEPEWLDELPAGDPRAQRSRRDLTRINAIMGNGFIVARELQRLRPRSIAEIGAGTGTFLMKRLDRIAPAVTPGEVVLVDRQAIVADETLEGFAGAGWRAQARAADVFDWLSDPATPVFDVIVANLFLHHFETPRLARLLALVARRARAFVACEPRRSTLALAGARALGIIGCNDVSRHDAVVSVRAGFGAGELSALWPAEGAWILEERARGLFSHSFVARFAPSPLGEGHP